MIEPQVHSQSDFLFVASMILLLSLSLNPQSGEYTPINISETLHSKE
jgi:hypothetical protein